MMIFNKQESLVPLDSTSKVNLISLESGFKKEQTHSIINFFFI